MPVALVTTELRRVEEPVAPGWLRALLLEAFADVDKSEGITQVGGTPLLVTLHASAPANDTTLGRVASACAGRAEANIETDDSAERCGSMFRWMR